MPKAKSQLIVRQITQRRLDGKARHTSVQPNRDAGTEQPSIVGRKEGHRCSISTWLRDAISPGGAPIVAMFNHRQPPFQTAQRQPTELIGIAPMGRLDHGVLVKDWRTARFVDHLPEPPA